MKVLFWMFTGFDRQTTSGHLLSAMIEQLCKSGHTVHILQKMTGGTQSSIPEQLKSYSVTTDCIPFNAADKTNFVARFVKELCYINKCKRFITKDFDAVFIQSTTVGGFAVKVVRNILKEAIVTFNVQDVFPFNVVYSGKIKNNGIIFKIMCAQQRYAYKKSDHVITISEDMKDLLVADGTPADKIEVIYNWSYQDEIYEHNKIDFGPISQIFNKDGFNVVYAGNIGVMQNVDILIEVAKLMKENKKVWFYVIGDGVYKNKLQARAMKFGISNISFWPMQPSELAPLIYCAADVNVIPLVKDVYKTALPSKTATCMACGRPIIFAIGKKSKFGELVEKETGCPVVESDNAVDFVNALEEIINNNKIKSNDIVGFYKRNMSITLNSKRYAELIVTKRI